ncbi:nucleoside monophosphate kinase [Candidatus Microgenomates bacterium]|nr:nucleoside monophosphate kinase [Candidatus Microgenomates bacterium]
MKVYLLYGPQGSGKSTQAKLLAERLNLILVSAGDISRDLAAKNETVKALVDKGEPTPQEFIVTAVNDIFRQNKEGGGFVLDGYPRYIEDVEPFAVELNAQGWEVTKVLFLQLSEQDALQRLVLRAKKENRADDTPDSISRRLELYHQQTQPIIDYFRRLGKVAEVDGSGTVEEVSALIQKALND